MTGTSKTNATFYLDSSLVPLVVRLPPVTNYCYRTSVAKKGHVIYKGCFKNSSFVVILVDMTYPSRLTLLRSN